MKNIIKLALLSAVLTLGGCKDFFDVDMDNIQKGDNYIGVESEMYAGYIGIITKMQAIGDKAIYLTDTRGELLEVTENAPSELINLYNYESDLAGNSYADPAGYYEVIIACNDYLSKMKEFLKNNPESITKAHFDALISCTLRIKAWIYLTMATVYGEAVWFDEPLQEYEDLSTRPVLPMVQVITKCRELLENGAEGLEGIDGSLSMSWKEWLDPNTSTAESDYRYWDYMTPDYVGLYSELCLWEGDYQKTVNVILNRLNTSFAASTSDGTTFMRNESLTGKFAAFWDGGTPYAAETGSAILYDYTQNQTNSLLRHFGTDMPNEYLLRPSEFGRNRFDDTEFNDLGSNSSDPRAGVTFYKNSAGQWAIKKFRPATSSARPNAYQDDVHIYIYRGSQYYFLLAEALNQLGRITEAAAMINKGVSGTFPNGGVTWAGFTDDWTGTTSTGATRKYPHKGIRGSFKTPLGNRTFSADDTKLNDLALLDEMLLEFPVEGKIYPAMIRIAQRYNDYNIIADRVCPKYSSPDNIRAKILAGGYFIKWDYKN